MVWDEHYPAQNLHSVYVIFFGGGGEGDLISDHDSADLHVHNIGNMIANVASSYLRDRRPNISLRIRLILRKHWSEKVCLISLSWCTIMRETWRYSPGVRYVFDQGYRTQSV